MQIKVRRRHWRQPMANERSVGQVPAAEVANE
jgi:hypothetical protein